MNVVLDDLTDPRIHGSALRMATTPIKGSTIRSIPFNDASEAVTISMNQLVAKDETWPPALRDDAFRAEREAYRQAVAAAMKEDEEGEISPKTLRDVRNAVAALRVKANKSIRKPSPDYIQAQQYIQALTGMTRMLENPNIEPILKELEKIENTTVGNLLGFMHTFNLRFGNATTPDQRAIYTELYPILVSHRDRVVKEAGIPPKGTEKDEEEGSPTDFFQGLERDQPEGQKRGADPGQGKAQDNGESRRRPASGPGPGSPVTVHPCLDPILNLAPPPDLVPAAGPFAFSRQPVLDPVASSRLVEAVADELGEDTSPAACRGPARPRGSGPARTGRPARAGPPGAGGRRPSGRRSRSRAGTTTASPG